MGKRNPRHDAVDRELFLATLQQTGGNITHAAQALGYSRKGLQLALTRLGVVRQTHTAYKSTQVRNEIRTSAQPNTQLEHDKASLDAYFAGTEPA